MKISKTTKPTREQIIKAADEWLLNDPESRLFVRPRWLVADAFEGWRSKTPFGKQESWDGHADMKFNELLTYVMNPMSEHKQKARNETMSFDELLKEEIRHDVRKSLIIAAEKLDPDLGRRAKNEYKSNIDMLEIPDKDAMSKFSVTDSEESRSWIPSQQHRSLLDDQMLEERCAYWYERLLATHGEMTLMDVLSVKPNRWGFYTYSQQWGGVDGDSYDVADALRVEKLSLPYPENAQAIVEFHEDTPSELKECEGIDMDIHAIRASVAHQGIVIARLDGYLLSWPKPDEVLSNNEFLDTCDALTQELAEFAYCMLNDHGSAEKIFANGGVFYLSQWEVAEAWRGHGIGGSLLHQTMAAVRRFMPTTNTVAVDLTPFQYSCPVPMMAPDEIKQLYRADRARLTEYWKRIYPDHTPHDSSRTLHFEIVKNLSDIDMCIAIASRNGKREHLSS